MRCLSAFVFVATAGLTIALLRHDHATVPDRERPGYDHPAEAARFFTEQRAWPDGIPTDWHDRATGHVRRMEEFGMRKSVAGWRWLSLGPENVAGRLRAMALDPEDPATIYAGSAGGGVWKSTNSGHDWRALDDLLPNLRIGALAVDPFDRTHVLAGCGEGYVAWQGGAAFGRGIYGSTDAGTSWSVLPGARGTAFDYVFDLDFDPHERGAVLACTGTGVYRSGDGGASWTRVLTRPVIPFSATVAYSKTDPGVVYSAIESAGIFRSSDGGRTWTGPLGTGLTVARYSRVVLAAAPTDGRIVYAAFTGHDEHCAGMFRSDDGGSNWRAVSIPRSDLTGDTYMGGQGRFNSALAVHPRNPDVLWAGGIDLYRSTDGGETWRQQSNWYRFQRYPYVHADNHVICFNPANPDEILSASDGGLFRSTDGGASFTERSAGMVTVQFHSGTPHPRTDLVIGGTIDNGTLTAFDGMRWSEVAGGDGGYTAIDPDEPRYVYAELYYLHFLRSTDFGRSFQLAMIGIPRASGFGTSDPVAFIAPFEMSPRDPRVLYAGTNRLFRSGNRAESWDAVSPNLAGDGYLTAIGLAPSDPAVLYVGASKGRAQRSSDGGASWRRIDAGLPARWITDIAVHASDARRAVYTVSGFGTGHAWITTDGGGSWRDISGVGSVSLPDVPANTVFWHPRRDSVLYVGTDVGLFVTTDLGSTWRIDNNGMGNVIIADLKMRRDGVLFAATHGRGMYRSSVSLLDGGDEPTIAALGAPYPNPVSPSDGHVLTIPYTLARGGRVHLRATDLAGRTVCSRDLGPQDAGEYRHHFDSRRLSAGAHRIELLFDGRGIASRRVIVLR
ncbi:MAG: hypothetical protein RBU27_14105 [Bacteroidota bacterium]|jgi:photosystem II stability/assembly factor-like uncharacterized protein|nr:hypothetical protein [Bacteroidota bacterium]